MTESAGWDKGVWETYTEQATQEWEATGATEGLAGMDAVRSIQNALMGNAERRNEEIKQKKEEKIRQLEELKVHVKSKK